MLAEPPASTSTPRRRRRDVHESRKVWSTSGDLPGVGEHLAPFVPIFAINDGRRREPDPGPSCEAL